MQLPRLAQAFQRGNGFVEGTAQRQRAGTGGDAVDQYRASTALPEATAIFGAIQAQIVA
ncbi:hypothetical protein D3C76_1471900 [compost metagenome]